MVFFGEQRVLIPAARAPARTLQDPHVAPTAGHRALASMASRTPAPASSFLQHRGTGGEGGATRGERGGRMGGSPPLCSILCADKDTILVAGLSHHRDNTGNEACSNAL